MWEKLLRLDGTGEVTGMEWQFRLGWPAAVLWVAVAVAVGYAVWLYRARGPLTRRRRVLLGALRAAVLVMVVLLLFEPVLGVRTTVDLPRTVLVLTDVSDSMNLADARRRPRDRRAAALALGKVSYDRPDAPLNERTERQTAAVARIDLARGLLRHPTHNVFEKIARSHRVRHFWFGEGLTPARGKGSARPEALGELVASDKATRLGTALEGALARFSGQSISGVILLTDGASNEGLDPLEVARRMKERAVPLFPVGLGLSDPPDIRLDAVLVPQTVFAREKVPVRVQLSSTGFADRTAVVTLTWRGQEVDRKEVTLTDGARFVELLFEPERKARGVPLEVAVAPKLAAEEASTDNNRVRKTVDVIDEKIHVLYVEGKPRWEYRYLRRVLLRDRRLDVKFLMTEGDKDLPNHSPRYLKTFPMTADQAFGYHLVILGDVARTYFSDLQLARMEEMVQQRGGALLVLAGIAHTPGEYVGTPIETMLPVTLRGQGARAVDEMVHPRVPADALRSAVVALEYPPERNQALWSRVRPLQALARLDGAKKGATTLLTLSDEARRREPYPLVAWQRYRRGKVMYVGTDQLWRLRFKQGDKYHARFWGQAIQFLTLSRLLGGNRRMELGTDKKDYRLGERVRLSANVLDESYSPSLAPSFDVTVVRRGESPSSVRVRLEAVGGLEGLFQGFYAPEQAGRYELQAADAPPAAANVATFDVAEVSLERQEPAMQERTLRQMAELSGGQYVSLEDVPKLADLLGGRRRTATMRQTRELFDLPLVFCVLLVLVGMEWLLRRRYDLA